MPIQTIEERVAEIRQMANNHDAMIGLLIAIGERQQAMLERQETILERHSVLWARLANKMGWLDEE